MTIEKINNLSHSFESKKTATIRKNNISIPTDNIQISDVARKKAEEIKLQEDVKFFTNFTINRPEDSQKIQRLAEIKLKMKNGDYDNPSAEMLDKIADRLTSIFISGGDDIV